MARDRANAAAQAMFDAESALDVLAVEIADTEADVAALEGEVGLMRDSLAQRAVQRFTQGGTVGSPLFTPVEQINAVTSADVYTGIANDSTLTSMDDFQMAIEELEDARADLEEQRAEEVAARESYEALKPRPRSSGCKRSSSSSSRPACAGLTGLSNAARASSTRAGHWSHALEMSESC